jgi:hypothetical protein
VLAPELAGDERFRRRFLLESQLAARLEHPHIVPIYGAGEVEDVLYLAMKYVEGLNAVPAPRPSRIMLSPLSEIRTGCGRAAGSHASARPLTSGAYHGGNDQAWAAPPYLRC